MSTALLLLLAVVGLATGSVVDLVDCKYTSDAGKVYDLSPLISTSQYGYYWNQTVLDTTDNLLTNPSFSASVNLGFQLQFCRNITTLAFPTYCKTAAQSAPVYVINFTTRTCYAHGSLESATIELNPYNDGVYLDYYNGDAVDHITRREARVYFTCDPSVMQAPAFEHLKDSYQGHFAVPTKYAC